MISEVLESHVQIIPYFSHWHVVFIHKALHILISFSMIKVLVEFLG